MIHSADIRGTPWTPCAACPHPTPGSCPSRRHPALCAELEASAAWAPVVAAMPAEDRPAVPRHCIPIPPPQFVGPPDPPSPDPDPEPEPDAEPEPAPDRTARIILCPHRQTTCHCLRKPATCTLDPDNHRLVILVDCKRCPLITS
jgi:hypothetical protein